MGRSGCAHPVFGGAHRSSHVLRCGGLLVCLLLSWSCSSAPQIETDAPPVDSDAPQRVDAHTGAAGYPVMLDGDEVFRVDDGFVGALGPEERARSAEARLRRIANDPFYSEGLLTLEAEPGRGVAILYRGATVGFVGDASSGLRGNDAEQRAAEIVQAVQAAVQRYRDRRRPREWMRSTLLLGAATLALVIGLVLISRTHRALSVRLRDLATGDGRRVLLWFEQGLGPRLAPLAGRSLSVLRALLSGLLVAIYLQVAFAIVPLTRGYASGVLAYLLDPLAVLGRSLLENLGDLVFILVMVGLAILLLRMLRAIVSEVSHGTLALPGFPQDRALAIYKIIRIAILAITAVTIYPYIPGSSSAAFQGISLFAGALFTLGASSTASNFIGGMVLLFSGAFRIGDHLKIGAVEGDVEEATLLLTKLKTQRNELVTFSNGSVLSLGFVNYSTLAEGPGLIVHTEITIGYDVPWRQVHELLEDAALATRQILALPRPFVRQRSLNDFHVTYEINAFTRSASSRIPILAELHARIQDAFASAGVEILSPAYAAYRDGSHCTVPVAKESA